MIELKKQGPKGLCQYNKANRHKSRYQRHTDRQTNRPTNRVAYKVGCTRLKRGPWPHEASPQKDVERANEEKRVEALARQSGNFV